VADAAVPAREATVKLYSATAQLVSDAIKKSKTVGFALPEGAQLSTAPYSEANTYHKPAVAALKSAAAPPAPASASVDQKISAAGAPAITAAAAAAPALSAVPTASAAPVAAPADDASDRNVAPPPEF
jgi:hypothetical protein